MTTAPADGPDIDALVGALGRANSTPVIDTLVELESGETIGAPCDGVVTAVDVFDGHRERVVIRAQRK